MQLTCALGIDSRRCGIFALSVWVLAPTFTTAAPAASVVSISTVQATASTPGTAVVAWQTSLPSTSQVVFIDSGNVPISASPIDNTLATAHSVTVPVHPGTTYTYYVVSTAQGVIASSSSSPTSFSTPSVNASVATTYRLQASGATSVYQGHDLYVGIVSTLLTGPQGHLYFDPPLGLPAGATFHVICAYNTNITDEAADSWWDTTGRQWCYNGTDASFIARIRTAPTTPTGTDNFVVHTTASGSSQDVTVTVAVLPPPHATVKRAPREFSRVPLRQPAIPSISVWEQKMTSLGQQWCNPSEQMIFGYEPQIWYYDGGRTYFQIGDYTGQPANWEPCALNIVNQYRDYVLQGGTPGWRVFPHGLAMNYWRTGDTKSRDAVIALANSSAYANQEGGVSPTMIRETAYLIETWTITEQLGLPHDPRLDRAVDFGLGIVNQIVNSDGSVFHQPFMDGLMAEALIDYYGLTQDPRVPPVIKGLLDYVFVNGWNDSTQQMAYNTLEVPADYVTGLNNLLAPAFAWYWALTGDPVYQQRGDELFSVGVNQDMSYSGKIYNQNYRWSFDYVRWRQQGTAVPSAYLTGAGTTPPQSVLSVTVAASVGGGGTTTATVWLSRIAQQDTLVTLSQTSNVLQVPASVMVSAGLQRATFSVTATNVAQGTSATIVASLNGASVQASLMVTPAAWGNTDIASVWVRPTSTTGIPDTVTVFLTTPAPLGGIPVKLSSSNPALVSLPATVTVPAGASQIGVWFNPGTTTTPTNVVVQGTVVTTKAATIQVVPRR